MTLRLPSRDYCVMITASPYAPPPCCHRWHHAWRSCMYAGKCLVAEPNPRQTMERTKVDATYAPHWKGRHFFHACNWHLNSIHDMHAVFFLLLPPPSLSIRLEIWCSVVSLTPPPAPPVMLDIISLDIMSFPFTVTQLGHAICIGDIKRHVRHYCYPTRHCQNY